MMHKSFAALILWFMTLTLTHAQVKFADEPSEFFKQAETMMKNTKNERSIEAFNAFSSVWNGTLSAQNKKSIIQISQVMAKKRLRATTNFTDFYSAIGHAGPTRGMSNQDIDSLLLLTNKVLEKYDPKQLNDYFSTINQFIQHHQLYASSYNRLAVTGGTFKFRYVEAPIVEIPEPVIENSQAGNDGWDDWNDPTDHFDDWDKQDKVEDSWGGGWDDWDTPSNNDASFNNTSNVFDVGYMAPAQPTISGAVIELEGADLSIITAHDSTTIKGTSGALLLKDGTFVGNGGTFDWSLAGYEPSELYAEFKEYNFNVKSPKLSAEPVLLHFPSRTDEPVEGVFDYKSQKHVTQRDLKYPRFKSFASNIKIKGLDENIDYYGGLALEGRRLYSSSIDEGKATMLIKHNGEVKIKAVANRFEMGDSTITGNITSIVLYQGNDSIYHPGAIFHFNRSNSILRLTKTSSYRQTPFIDTYHNMEIIVDALIWDLNSSKIDFSITNAAAELPATFESHEYFDVEKYSRLQGMYRFHPLQMIVGYAEAQRRNGETEFKPFYTSDLARLYKYEETTLRGAMTMLMKLGFIDYNVKTGEIKLRDKAVHYVLSRRDKKDYDNLTFKSLEPSGNNATLDLDTKDLTVRGVDKVRIMDSLQVFIVPDSKTLIIKGDRGFSFDGKINTSNFQFIGRNFEFNYDSFFVRMPEIDQIKLAAVDPNEKNAKSEKKSRVVTNELRYSSGTLYINKPDNKSGRINYPEYPIFDANGGASVLFNKKEIAGGIYDSTIQFKIPPFRVDSLASEDPQTIGFDGEFVSGGIFPEFKTKLVMMPDFSLGFEYKVPHEGFQLYEGKGKYFNKITMDNRGLTGNGRIEFLNTTCYSDEFHFFKDSVMTIGSNAETKPGPNAQLKNDILFPEFTIHDYDMIWKPKADSMNISNISEPFKFYKETATLYGMATITEKGVLGSGVLETRGTISASSNFHFEEKRYAARNTIFTVKSDNPSKPALKASDCRLNFDLEKEEAVFSPEIAGFASTEFPYLRYKTSIAKGTWDMKKKKVLMTTEGNDISNSYFYSTHPGQDSLVFNAQAGIYDMVELALKIEGVPYIEVMDGKIFPDSNKVIIRENAQMETLRNAKAHFDGETAYHKLHDGTFDIKGRYKLKGEATYNYTNSSSDHYVFRFKNYAYLPIEDDKKGSKKKQKESETTDAQLLANNEELNTEPMLASEQGGNAKSVKKEKTSKTKKSKKEESGDVVDTEEQAEALPEEKGFEMAKKSSGKVLPHHTVAQGIIQPEDSIELAKKIKYKGKVTMFSDVRSLSFDGFVRLDLKGALKYSQWLAFKHEGDSADIKILLEDPKADNGNQLTTGLHINKSYDIYTTFISEKDASTDFDIFKTKGVLKFSSHPDSSIFRVASAEKFKKTNMPGNLLIYDDNESTIDYSGKFNFIEPQKSFSLTTAGTGSAILDSSFYNFNTMMLFTYDLHKSIPEAIAKNLRAVTDILPPDEKEMLEDYDEVQLEKEKQNHKLLELIGTKSFENYINKSALQYMPIHESSKELAEGILISDADLKWSNQYKAWYSIGKIKVANIYKQEIDRYMTGYIEIRKTLSGDVVTLMLEPTEYNWFFFTYDDNRTAITTSNDEVNMVIAKKSKGEAADRDKPYFVEADMIEKINFLKNFKEKYLKDEGGYISDRKPKVSDQKVEDLKEEEDVEPVYDLDQEYREEENESNKKKNNQGTVIEEPERNREVKQHSLEEKKRLQQEQQRMKDLFK